MPEIHQKRRENFRAVLHKKDLPAALITDLVNVRYLSGFTGSNAALIISQDSASDLISTDGRYSTQISTQSGDLEALIDRRVVEALIGELVKKNIQKIGFEANVVSVALYKLLSELGEFSFVDLEGAIEQLRAVKDDTEIELLVRAGAISDQALTDLITGPICDNTERTIARRLENLLFDHGATGISFETIVASGVNSAIPHHRPTDRVIAVGDFLKIDFGAEYEGYHADITRTFVVDAAAAWQREIYAIVLDAQQSACKAASVGAALADIDAVARTRIDQAGYGDQFVHGLGHGVGLEVHEYPSVGPKSKGSLRVGEFITIEPGIYLSNRGGVRIEDTLQIQAQGTRSMTSFSKELMELSV